jgi:hypothetical protein
MKVRGQEAAAWMWSFSRPEEVVTLDLARIMFTSSCILDVEDIGTSYAMRTWNLPFRFSRTHSE